MVSICMNVLNTFDPNIFSLEDHIEGHLDKIQGLDDNMQTFITEVFAGCVRYDIVLRVVTDGFFARDGKRVLRSEENLYKVMCYLALFRLDEIGVAQYRRFVRSQDTNKMYKFLNFFFDEKNLRTWMKDEWTKCYETSFVQTTLLSPLLRRLPELTELVEHLKDKINNTIKPPRPKTKTTEVKPFNITQPRPRSVPMPEPIPHLQKHRPVPKALYTAPREHTAIAMQKEQNRRNAEERLMEASRIQFNCASAGKSEKTQKKIQSIMAEEESKLDFDKHKSHPVPSGMLNDNIPVKLNAAAILREGKLYKKREETELKKLEDLQAGARDPSDFLQWQNKMRQSDLDRELADIERRRLEGKMSHEDAILARSNLIQENKQKVAEMKAEADRLMKDYLERRLKEEEVMRDLVEQVMNTHVGAKEAKVKLQEYKAKIVQEVNEESKELMRRALEQAEEEMKQKMALIQQIRAMEATPVIRQKLVDLSEKAGHGLLSEMSISELKERVQHLKVKQLTEEEDKRDEILATKQAKDEMLMSTLETISRHRKEQSKAAAIKLEQRKKTRNEKPEVKDDRLMDLQRKLEEKREQRRKEQERAKLVPDKKSIQRIKALHNAKRVGEENRWSELERTRDRTARLVSEGVISSASASKLLMTNRGGMIPLQY